jgi:hypothetical protein
MYDHDPEDHRITTLIDEKTESFGDLESLKVRLLELAKTLPNAVVFLGGLDEIHQLRAKMLGMYDAVPVVGNDYITVYAIRLR